MYQTSHLRRGMDPIMASALASIVCGGVGFGLGSALQRKAWGLFNRDLSSQIAAVCGWAVFHIRTFSFLRFMDGYITKMYIYVFIHAYIYIYIHAYMYIYIYVFFQAAYSSWDV